MPMDDDAAKARRRELQTIMERVREEVPFPKMVIIQEGWFRDKIIRKSVDELQQEDRERAARR